MKSSCFCLLVSSSLLFAEIEMDSSASLLAKSRKPFTPLSAKTAPPQPDRFEQWDSSQIGLSFYGDFLYWKAYEEGLDFVLTGVENSLGTPPSSYGETFRPYFQWEPGYRVGAKYQYKEMWNLDFNWTQFNSSAQRRNYVSGIGNELNPSYWSVWTAPGGLGAGVNLSQGIWTLDYWTIELMTSVLFKPHPHFLLQPSCGFVSANINQEYNVNYTEGDGANFTYVQMRNKYAGNGLRGAFAFSWDPVRCFGFHTGLGASLLSGQFHVSENQANNLIFNGTLTTGHLGGEYLKVDHTPDAMRTEFDMKAGFHMRYPFSNACCIHFKTDWDLIVWFNQNQMLRFIGPDTIAPPQGFRGHFFPQQGDLFLQGLDVSLSLEF